jgi:hypothetical protein
MLAAQTSRTYENPGIASFYRTGIVEHGGLLIRSSGPQSVPALLGRFYAYHSIMNHEAFGLDLGSAITDAFDDLTREKVDYASDPGRWARERGKMHIWSKQLEVMESVRDNRRSVIRACHSSGKSYIAATIACWWLDSHPPGEAFVLSTAPTAPQVRAILWRNINRIHASAKLPGRCNQQEWLMPTGDGSEELVGIGRKPSEHSEGAFQGIHARYVLVILDESQGVPKSLWDGTESIASNKHARVLAIGNPDTTSGPFVDACNSPSLWNEIHIGFKHTPASTGEEVPEEVADGLISREWAEDRRIAWGEDSALYQSKVLGELPTGEIDPWRVISEEDAAKCRYIDEAYEDDPDAVRIGGLDVGGGGDRTVLVERVGSAVKRIESFTDRDPMSTVGRLVHLIEEWNLEKVRVDVIGVGWGVSGRLREVLKERGSKCKVQGVNFASRSTQPKRFANIRAEAYWNGRELSRNKAWSLASLDNDAIAELTVPRYKIADSSGKILIEAKDDIRERLGRSPDIADALLLAFYDGTGNAEAHDPRQAYAGARLDQITGTYSHFGGPQIEGLPFSIPTPLGGRLTR